VNIQRAPRTGNRPWLCRCASDRAADVTELRRLDERQRSRRL